MDLRLTSEELGFFKREGYLFKRGVMDPELMAQARDRLWMDAPPRLKRDDPSTWFGPFQPDEEIDRAAKDSSSVRGGHTWKFREASAEEWLIRMSATDATIWGWVEQLLGKGKVLRPERIRGIYLRLPEAEEEPEQPLKCHCDAFNPDSILDSSDIERLLRPRLSLIGLIAPIPPRGGATTVWPRTHRAIYDVFANFEGQERMDVYKEKLKEFDQQTPVEACGEAGDILFWHNLLGHTAGHNRSKKLQLRELLMADWDTLDTAELKSQRPHTDMWHEWSEEIQAAPF